MKIIFNVGNFGGQEVEVSEGQEVIEMTDESGVWLYSQTRHPNTTTADFLGMK